MKSIHGTQNNCRARSCSWTGRLNIVKVSALPEVLTGISAIPIKTSLGFWETWWVDSKTNTQPRPPKSHNTPDQERSRETCPIRWQELFKQSGIAERIGNILHWKSWKLNWLSHPGASIEAEILILTPGIRRVSTGEPVYPHQKKKIMKGDSYSSPHTTQKSILPEIKSLKMKNRM